MFIPISDWEELKAKFKGIEEEETYDIPEWHKDVVLARLEEFKKNPEYTLDFESAMDDLEKWL